MKNKISELKNQHTASFYVHDETSKDIKYLSSLTKTQKLLHSDHPNSQNLSPKINAKKFSKLASSFEKFKNFFISIFNKILNLNSDTLKHEDNVSKQHLEKNPWTPLYKEIDSICSKEFKNMDKKLVNELSGIRRYFFSMAVQMFDQEMRDISTQIPELGAVANKMKEQIYKELAEWLCPDFSEKELAKVLLDSNKSLIDTLTLDGMKLLSLIRKYATKFNDNTLDAQITRIIRERGQQMIGKKVDNYNKTQRNPNKTAQGEIINIQLVREKVHAFIKQYIL